MKCLLSVCLILLCMEAVRAQERLDTTSFCIMAYNVENLFDCRHDTLKDDYEFLPGGIRHWTYSRYKQKLDNVARVITAVGGWNPPALVALCEVENDRVLRDLTRYSALREHGYRYILTHSEDRRGIDVAVLYRRDLFKPLQWQSLRVERPHASDSPTRDILHVSGLLWDLDTLDVLIAHFPSRAGRTARKDLYRQEAARLVRATADSLFRVRKRARIVITGDFNEPPQGSLIRETLRAQMPPRSRGQVDERALYHLLMQKAISSSQTGTYKYRGHWQWLDHILVSGSLLCPGVSLATSEERAGVFSPAFLLEEDLKFGGVKPFRTYYGMRYQGGYSDHLPVFVWFTLIY